jgi:preprotein translocase subunit Sec63
MIDEIEHQLRSRDDFELFGIDEASTDADVRMAYDALIGNLRLDRTTSEQKGQRTQVRELRVRLEQAYQRVRAADTRTAVAGLRK